MKIALRFAGFCLALVAGLQPGMANAFCVGPIIKQIKAIAADPKVVEAVRKHNAQGLKIEHVQALDDRWLKHKGDLPEAKAMLESDVSKFLSREAAKQSYFKEAILTGRLGENVAMYPVTTDYWQGDEDKFLEIFDNTIPPKKKDHHISRARWDESSKAMIAQVSVGVFDGNQMIGTLTMGVDLKRVPYTH
ncbi:MAG TPA: hypothetical protein VFV57_00320 [Limnobacter sp.]|nr:hypothetical protein [Limnobacter sp.]